MKTEFPSIEKVAQKVSGLLSIEPIALDIEWAAQFKKSCKSETDLDVALTEQVSQGNVLRVAWLLEGVCHVSNGVWPLTGSTEKKTPSKTGVACHILKNYSPLQGPQRHIFDYIMQANDILEFAVAEAAIRYHHNNLLPHLVEFSGQRSCRETAITSKNIEALDYILRLKARDDLSEKNADGLRGALLSLYNVAAKHKNIEALDGIKSYLPLEEDELVVLSEESIKHGRMETAEWLIQAGANTDKAFQSCMKHGRFEFADRLLENYNANPDADDNAALENSLVDKKSNNVEYLADRGADMSKALPYIRDKKLGTSNFREKLSDIFAKRSVAKPLIDWYKEDDTTLVREHRTANLIHQTIFFFGEGEVALSVCNIKTSAQLNHKILSFAQFHNRELIKQAAQKLKGLKGDPGPENLPKAIQQIKTPHAMQKPLKPDS